MANAKPDPSPGNIIGNLETGDTYKVVDSQPYGPNNLICMVSYTRQLDKGWLMAVSWSSLYLSEFLAGKEWRYLAMAEADLPTDWYQQWTKEIEEYLSNKQASKSSTDEEERFAEESPALNGYGTGYGQPPVYCSHEYVMYIGLSDTFEYCKHCNKKRTEIEGGPSNG